ncbi:hypothetical protein ACJQWK_05075 [Exserohilum turcicum]
MLPISAKVQLGVYEGYAQQILRSGHFETDGNMSILTKTLFLERKITEEADIAESSILVELGVKRRALCNTHLVTCGQNPGRLQGKERKDERKRNKPAKG